MQEMMEDYDIAFPHLGIYLRNVPKTFSIGNFSVAIYGILIAAAMLAGICMAAHMAKRTKWRPDVVWDVSIWLIIFAIIGARIYYVVFFWDYYRDDPLQVFNLRGGGLAIYGGVIACILVIFVFCKVRKVNTFRLLDTAAYGLVLGQIIGRWGNFFNREVFGGYTDSLLAMRLPIAMVRDRDITEGVAAHIAAGTNYIQVHPTFLYEGLWNLGVLLVMLLVTKHKKFQGEITLLYFLGYGAGRAWIEYIRTDQLYITGTKIPVSIVVSVIMMTFAVVCDIVVRARLRSGKLTPEVAMDVVGDVTAAPSDAQENTHQEDAQKPE